MANQNNKPDNRLRASWREWYEEVLSDPRCDEWSLDLSERKQYVLLYRFGLRGAEIKSRKEVATEMGVTANRIAQIEGQVLRILRHRRVKASR